MTYAANDKAIRYRVGIDVGLRSIGFCAVEVDEHDQPLSLLNSTVFIHDAGVDPNENKAAKSRKLTAGVARRTRRPYQTTRQRLARLDRVLANEFGWPIIDLTRTKDPREPWRVVPEAIHLLEHLPGKIGRHVQPASQQSESL